MSVGDQTQVLPFVWQVSYPLSQHPSFYPLLISRSLQGCKDARWITYSGFHLDFFLIYKPSSLLSSHQKKMWRNYVLCAISGHSLQLSCTITKIVHCNKEEQLDQIHMMHRPKTMYYLAIRRKFVGPCSEQHCPKEEDYKWLVMSP